MPQISRSALVPFSTEQMFKLVNDVLTYPDFLPGCVGSKLIKSTPEEMIASINVSKAGISKTFTTHNFLKTNERVDMHLVDGPFRKLTGGWVFTALDDNACKIEFQLDFEFTNKLIELAFGRIFKDLTNNMVQAFTHRAKEIYRD
ncbi:type II toxin-antitoxin system RatA family toxin [Proteus sp. G2618]|uniref:SRPBCC family protein n=1 Tax=Proteus TaxID=583 RepID=UPI000D68540F|nr:MULTISPECIES: SRPBCC family protein [Proteus]NBN71426.1 type II toxin-antitoxin system RatA family toxin [Proteus sp. G2618]